MVELQPSKLDVAGSRPVSRSNPAYLTPAHLAQLAEHVLGKDEVTSSILVIGSRYEGSPGNREHGWVASEQHASER